MTSRKIKVCVVTSSFPRYESDHGGIFISNIISSMAENYEFHVIYPSNMEIPQIKSEPFIRHQVSYPFHSYPMSQVRGLDNVNAIPLFFIMGQKLKEVIRRYNIDLVHAYWAIPSGFIASLYRLDKPLIITLPGSDIKIFGKKRFLRYPVKYALKKASRLITVSNDMRQEAINLGIEKEKVFVIPAGVDTGKFKPMDKQLLRNRLGLDDGFLLIFAGSLFRVKRVDRLIKICSSLSRDFSCSLLIVGDGPERERLERLAYDLDFNNIQFKGKIPYSDMPQYIAAADVLVLASESEGLPGVAQEAMACGIPVVTSNVGGLPEIITDGMNGYLTINTTEMEERLKLLMASPQLVVTLGANALKFAMQNLSFDTVVKNTEELYTSLLGGD